MAADENHLDTDPDAVQAEISRANANMTAPTAKTLTYTGSAQALVTAGSAEGGTIKYAVTEDETEPADADYIYDNDSLPAGTDVNTYYVWYRVVGDENHNSTKVQSVEVTIAKATPGITAPTAKIGLIYTGSAQALVTAGEASGGTMYYAVTTENTAPTDDNLYTTSIPSKTNAGTYYVWYKVVGDENHLDTKSSSISVEINKAQVTVKADNMSKTTDKPDPELTATVTGTIGTDKVAYTLSRAEGTETGEYVITPVGEKEQGNYTVTYETGVFTNAEKQGDNIVIVVSEKTEGTIDPSIPETLKKKAEEVANNTTAVAPIPSEEKTSIINTVSKEDKDSAAKEGLNLVIAQQPVVKVKKIDTAESKMVVDIEIKYVVYATKATTAEDLKNDDHAKKVGEGTLDTKGQTVIVYVPLPDVFGNLKTIYVEHNHGNGEKHIYTAGIENIDNQKYAVIENPYGFSQFILSSYIAPVSSQIVTIRSYRQILTITDASMMSIQAIWICTGWPLPQTHPHVLPKYS